MCRRRQARRISSASWVAIGSAIARLTISSGQIKKRISSCTAPLRSTPPPIVAFAKSSCVKCGPESSIVPPSTASTGQSGASLMPHASSPCPPNDSSDVSPTSRRKVTGRRRHPLVASRRRRATTPKYSSKQRHFASCCDGRDGGAPCLPGLGISPISQQKEK